MSSAGQAGLGEHDGVGFWFANLDTAADHLGTLFTKAAEPLVSEPRTDYT